MYNKLLVKEFKEIEAVGNMYNCLLLLIWAAPLFSDQLNDHMLLGGTFKLFTFQTKDFGKIIFNCLWKGVKFGHKCWYSLIKF